MFSKLTFRIFLTLGLCLSLLLTGCDKFLKSKSAEVRKASDKVEISTDQVKCLQKTADHLKAFLGDEGDGNALPEAVQCVQNSLKTFMRLTRGSQPNGYLAREVQYFFNTFLLKDNQVSDQFLAEIMKVKVAAVGGSPDVVTRLELEQFGEFLGQLQVVLQPLRGKMQLLLFHGDAFGKGKMSDNSDDLLELRRSLSDIVQFVLKKTKLTSSRYQWVDFISFLHELHGFVGESKSLEEVFRWVPLAESLKLLFLGENAKFVSDSEWQSAGSWTVDTYVTALKYFYQIKDNPFQTPAQWKSLMSWIDEGLEAIETAPAMKDRKVLEAQNIDRLIDEIYKLNLFQTVLSPDMAKSVYRQALVHMIEAPAGRGDPLTVQGLTEEHMKVLKQEYNVWKLSQNFLIDVYSAHPVLNLTNLRWYVNRYEIERVLLDTPSMEREELERSWVDFKNILNSQPGLIYGKKNKLRIAAGSETEVYPFVGANMLNGLRSFTRLVLRGYGDRQTRFVFDSKISRQRIMHLEEDFREFGRAIGLLDPRETNSASRTFDQSNFFTFHGNGDESLTAMETLEIFNMMLSGARTQLTEMYADLKLHNCLLDSKDIFGKPFVKESCFYQLLQSKADVYLDNLPYMGSFLKSMDHQQFAKAYQALLSLSKSKTHKDGQLESSEIRSMNTIYHFLESLMLVYDRDQNQHLSEDEVLASLPRFGPFIEKMIAKRPSWVDRTVGPYLEEDILLYLAFEGREPTATGLAMFKVRRMTGLGEVDRGDLLTLLSVLNNLLNSTANAH